MIDFPPPVNPMEQILQAGHLNNWGLQNNMERVWRTTAKVLSGLFACAMCAMPQATISARPGVVNYIEGHAYVDGHELNASKLKGVALYANQTLSTDIGKAEILLTPGVFLRIGDNSAIRMISPSLTDTQFEVIKGEAMIEAAQVVKDNNIEAINHGAVIRIEKAGLYRVNAENPPTVSVFDGKADVRIGGAKQQVKKGRELILAAGSKPVKFDKKKGDDLYAWSNVRSEYEAGASYASARTAAAAGFANGGLGYGFGGAFGPGWYYNSPWNSWAWLPGDGYAFSPFGYGFFSPGYVGYAPVIVGGGGYPGGNGHRGGHWDRDHDGDRGHDKDHDHDGRGNWHGHNGALVPVNPNRPPAQGMAFRSPAALSAARSAAVRSGVGNRAMMAAPRAGMAAGTHMGGGHSGGGHYGGGHYGGGGHTGTGVGPAHSSGAFGGAGRAGGGAGGHAGHH